MTKYVYLFDEGNKDMRDLLGGKGANLAEMTNMSLPVPSGFTITTEACTSYYNNNEELETTIIEEIKDTIKKLEAKTQKEFGSPNNPLLLSVRSGAPISMPGMMDTILNLGLNDEIAKELAQDEDSKRFVYDSYRRLIMMFADVVKGKGKNKFEKLINDKKIYKGVKLDIDLSAEDMYDIAMESKNIYIELTGKPFPEDSYEQLIEAIKAVFRSWNTERAIVYRRINNIKDDLGTAVNVQEMVYGNLTDDSLTGVAFSRNPATGENELYGEYLEKAQGEDIVSGVRTPKSVEALKRDYPNIYEELKDTSKILEKHYKDMQDMEFTVEKGKLYMLQTRNGKRTTNAALEILLSLVDEGLITKEEAILRLEPEKLDEVLHPSFSEEALKNAKLITTGLPASPGAARGKIYFTVKDVLKAKEEGLDPILVRLETSAEDIEGMNSAVGIITVHGGMTSHAAVVARGIGRCCVSGCQEISIDEKAKTMTVNGETYNEGAEISIDGSSGKIYDGILEVKDFKLSDSFNTIINWCKDYKHLEVRTNADTGKDAKAALNFGAEGLGLCRTEHMFFEEDKILSMRKMIIASTKEEREKALEEILPMQTKDFEELFKEMSGKKVVIRYLDPPLHEFLPKEEKEIEKLAKSLQITKEDITKKIEELKEFNPMMGHRGSRLSVTYPEIAEMQTKAVITAAINVLKQDFDPKPEIMLPLIGDIHEFKYLKEIVKETAKKVMEENETEIEYQIGTMIEVPRSAIIADELAKEASFFSFGTNDLTQMTYGFSRDDAAKFLNDYYEKGIFKTDPFKTVDKEGVGKLIKTAIKLAKKENPNIELGVCGEHGGNPESIEFFHEIGLNYVSCSPYRVPIAIVSAAKAALKE